jgi:hypothetical protein
MLCKLNANSKLGQLSSEYGTSPQFDKLFIIMRLENTVICKVLFKLHEILSEDLRYPSGSALAGQFLTFRSVRDRQSIIQYAGS